MAGRPSRRRRSASAIGIALDAGRGLSDRAHVAHRPRTELGRSAARIAAQSDVEFAVADERQAHRRGAERPALPQPARAATQRRAGGGPVVPEAARPRLTRRTAPAPAAINAEQAWDIDARAARASSSPCSTPACASTTPTCRAATSLPGYDMVERRQRPASFMTANDGDGRDADASDPGDWVTAGRSQRARARC